MTRQGKRQRGKARRRERKAAARKARADRIDAAVRAAAKALGVPHRLYMESLADRIDPGWRSRYGVPERRDCGG